MKAIQISFTTISDKHEVIAKFDIVGANEPIAAGASTVYEFAADDNRLLKIVIALVCRSRILLAQLFAADGFLANPDQMTLLIDAVSKEHNVVFHRRV